jgi:hypothetical protein
MCDAELLKKIYKEVTGSSEFTAIGVPGYTTRTIKNGNKVLGFFTIFVKNGRAMLQHFVVSQASTNLLSNAKKLIDLLRGELKQRKVNTLLIECPVAKQRLAMFIEHRFWGRYCKITKKKKFNFYRKDGEIQEKIIYKAVI